MTTVPKGKVNLAVMDVIEETILSIEITKPSVDSKLGFTYKVLEDGIIVASVSGSGLFGNTALAKGQEIISINGKNVQGYDKTKFRSFLGDIASGPVKVVIVDKPKKWARLATNLTCTATKPEADSKLGFTYKTKKDGIMVETVKEEGLFSGTDLAKGQEVLSVNGTSVQGMDKSEFKDVLAALGAGEVSIVVADHSAKWATRGEIVPITATKPEADSKLGFTYKVHKDSINVEVSLSAVQDRIGIIHCSSSNNCPRIQINSRSSLMESLETRSLKKDRRSCPSMEPT